MTENRFVKTTHKPIRTNRTRGEDNINTILQAQSNTKIKCYGERALGEERKPKKQALLCHKSLGNPDIGGTKGL